jgi:hypothetical protein
MHLARDCEASRKGRASPEVCPKRNSTQVDNEFKAGGSLGFLPRLPFFRSLDDGAHHFRNLSASKEATRSGKG